MFVRICELQPPSLPFPCFPVFPFHRFSGSPFPRFTFHVSRSGIPQSEMINGSEFGYPLGVPNLEDSTFRNRHLEWIPPLFSDRIKSAIRNPQSEIEEHTSH